MDLVCLLVGSFIGIMVRFGHEDITQYVYGYREGWLLLFGAILLANYLSGSYRLQYMYSRFNLVVTWLFSLVFALFILSMTSYAWFTVVLGRGVLVLSILSYSALSLFLKLLVYRALFRSELFLCRTAIIGMGKRAEEIRKVLESDLVLPAHKVVTFVRVIEGEPSEHERLHNAVAVVECRAEELENVLRSLSVKLVVVGAEEEEDRYKLYPLLTRLRFQGIEIMSPLSVSEMYAGRTPLDLITPDIMVQLGMDCEFPMLKRAKRVFDILLSLLGIIVTLPLFFLVALAVKCSDWRSPVIYCQRRVGQFGKEFRIFKFRTMRPDAEKETGAVWASEHDPRITAVGRFLRTTRLDELPQFWNILNGDMSVVGPRPERPELITQLIEMIPHYAERENVVPGLTGWAQVRYPYGSNVDDARRKLEYDLYYVKHLSLSLDLQIILSTLRIVIFGKERAM